MENTALIDCLRARFDFLRFEKGDKKLSVELTIVIPTYNEYDNIRPLLEALDKSLRTNTWEVIFVDDDSSDGTADLVRQIATTDRRVRCLQRIGRRGLSSACIEGILASAAPYVAVMDADLQHDETLLPEMLRSLKQGHAIVVGSRYMVGGGLGNWKISRRKISQFATSLSRLIVKAELSDPMSGFFMLRRDFFQNTVHSLSGKGFKILLDIFASAPQPIRFKELPYHFRTRHTGESKLNMLTIAEYFLLILDKLIGRYIPVRFTMFVTVGALGALVHVTILGLFLKIWTFSFLISQAVAIGLAMTMNYLFNNLFTYQDRRLHGWQALKGLGSFYLVCAVGAFANLQIASFLFDLAVPWWLAGLLGAVVGSVWNYTVTSWLTWSRT